MGLWCWPRGIGAWQFAVSCAGIRRPGRFLFPACDLLAGPTVLTLRAPGLVPGVVGGQWEPVPGTRPILRLSGSAQVCCGRMGGFWVQLEGPGHGVATEVQEAEHERRVAGAPQQAPRTLRRLPAGLSAASQGTHRLGCRYLERGKEGKGLEQRSPPMSLHPRHPQNWGLVLPSLSGEKPDLGWRHSSGPCFPSKHRVS